MVGVLLKEITQTKASIARRRATLKAEWQQLDAAAVPLGRAEEAIFAGVIAEHQAKLQELSRQRLRAEEEAARSDRAAEALDACITEDLLALKEVLRLPFDSSSGAVSQGMPQLERMRENKQAMHARLMRQIDRADTLRNEAAKHAEKAAEAVRKNEVLMRSLAGGHKMFLFDPQQATLSPCEVWLQPDAEGRARLLCGFADRRALEVSLSTIGAVGPAYPNAVAKPPAPAAHQRGWRGPLPPQAWLHWRLSWNAAGWNAAGSSAAKVGRDAAAGGGRASGELQLVANRREHASNWIMGLQQLCGLAEQPGGGEPGGAAARPWRLGSLVWLSARLMVSQQARDHGKSPGKVLAETLMRTAADFVAAQEEIAPGSTIGGRRKSATGGEGGGGPAGATAPPAEAETADPFLAYRCKIVVLPPNHPYLPDGPVRVLVGW